MYENNYLFLYIILTVYIISFKLIVTKMFQYTPERNSSKTLKHYLLLDFLKMPMALNKDSHNPNFI